MLYTNGAEVMSMKFNARGTANVDWFTQNNLLQSPWTDLKNATTLKPFRINGHHGARNFEITTKYAGCRNDVGWIMIGDVTVTGRNFTLCRQFCTVRKLTKSHGMMPKVEIDFKNLGIPLLWYKLI